MAHVRQQIREAAATALTGLTTSGSRVYQSRIHPLDAASLPCLLVFSMEEDVDFDGDIYPRLQQRSLQLSVRAVAKASSNLDDTLDTMCAEVEAVLGGVMVVGGRPMETRLERTSIRLDAESDKPVGEAEMVFRVVYFTLENAPTVAN